MYLLNVNGVLEIYFEASIEPGSNFSDLSFVATSLERSLIVDADGTTNIALLFGKLTTKCR